MELVQNFSVVQVCFEIEFTIENEKEKRGSQSQKKSPIFFITHRSKYWQIGKDLCVIFRKRGNLCLVSVDKQLEQSLATPRSIVDAMEKTVFGHDLLSLAKKDFLLSLYY